MNYRLKAASTICFLFLFSPEAFAHKNHNAAHPIQVSSKAQNDQLSQINEIYRRDVKPILQKKCFDCHSQATKYPWYYKVPGVKQLIDSDIEEAKKHLDFSNDFPFGGHGVLVEDLVAIGSVVKENSMPPFRYWILHSGSGLSEEDRGIILEWIDQSQEILNERTKMNRPVTNRTF